MIYFDYTATTPIDEEVLNTYIKTQKSFFANSTSLHKLGQMSNYIYEKATQDIQETLNLKNFNLVYTSNATEANNLGIYGIVDRYKEGKIITTKIEHPSVFEVYKNLENKGFTVVYLDVDKNGIINLEQLKENMDKNTLLVSIMWVNNIVGAIQPIEEVVKIIKNYPKTKLHVDAVQGLCKIVPNFDFNDVDILTFSGHKIYGPKGIGILAFKKNIELEKRLYGSSAQYGIKPGTIDIALIVSLTKTIKLYYPKTKEHYETVLKLNKYFREKLRKIPTIVINNSVDSSPYILSLSFKNINGETVVHSLEAEEIYVSTGSACSSKLKKPEKTILSMTNSIPLATSSIRISLSHLTTFDEINKFIEVVEKISYV